MESIIKVGGSLARDPKSLRALCPVLSELAGEHNFLIVPGGGKFADTVREFDREYCLSAETSHKMAVLSMDQYAMLLADLISNSRTVYSLEEAEVFLSEGGVPILLPSRSMFTEDPLDHSWDFTSDSIAAWIAGSSNAERLILVTDVDGVFSQDQKGGLGGELVPRISVYDLLKEGVETCVDMGLPKILPKIQSKCYVVNGKHPSRIRKILEEKKTVCTRITV
ncbi:hypothetical protein AKJ43_02085 [candidate division MSBL1 archaeon SCGC-AAA261D19]|uniref:Aspartate/glutamate/uridylate kinase domain-containing protein n=1 Tax=candidate division MSBL1 archaeon SCGC-AAA261D19 TaxID=1698273 RepID=A0A133V760_9EURY|nr:hypothetical protein AKJ43_02085 [candidate division MSBL1 archaeon SCGC-AAA261D19]